MAERLRSRNGIPLGELYAHISGLYFRGKIAYARRFACPQAPGGGVHIITPNEGLLGPDTPITLAAFRRLATGEIDADNLIYRDPLERTARTLVSDANECEIVLLGSIASTKYVEVLIEIFGDRLSFPSAFVGRGDMSRGGLLLRQVALGRELDYVPVHGAVRRGPRPPRLGAQPVTVP